MSVDWLQDVYNDTLSTLHDKHAARRTVRRRHQPTTLWFDSDCAAAKRRARMFERRYRRTHSAADRRRRDWITEVRRKQRLYTAKQNSYWEAKIADSQGKLLKLWATLSAVLRREKLESYAADSLDAESFSKAFAAKVDGVRQSTVAADKPCFTDLNGESRFSAFQPVDAATVQRLIHQAANKNCELDPVPMWLVKQFAVELSPFIAALFSVMAFFRRRRNALSSRLRLRNQHLT